MLELEGVFREQILLRATNERKLERAMIANVLNGLAHIRRRIYLVKSYNPELIYKKKNTCMNFVL